MKNLHESEKGHLTKEYGGVLLGIEKGANLGITLIGSEPLKMVHTQLSDSEVQLLASWLDQNYNLMTDTFKVSPEHEKSCKEAERLKAIVDSGLERMAELKRFIDLQAKALKLLSRQAKICSQEFDSDVDAQEEFKTLSKLIKQAEEAIATYKVIYD